MTGITAHWRLEFTGPSSASLGSRLIRSIAWPQVPNQTRNWHARPWTWLAYQAGWRTKLYSPHRICTHRFLFFLDDSCFARFPVNLFLESLPPQLEWRKKTVMITFLFPVWRMLTKLVTVKDKMASEVIEVGYSREGVFLIWNTVKDYFEDHFAQGAGGWEA